MLIILIGILRQIACFFHPLLVGVDLMTNYPAFAKLLDHYLALRDRSGAWLAQRLGVNAATVSRWRNGESRPNRPEVVNLIADLLSMSHNDRNQLVQSSGYSVTVAHSAPTTTREEPLETATPWHDYYTPSHTWQPYPASYRQAEIATIAQWVSIGASGILLGLAGSGVTTILHHLVSRPQLIGEQRIARKSVAPIWIDLQPTAEAKTTTPMIYRLFLRGVLEAATRIPHAFPTKVIETCHLFLDNNDPIRLQTTLSAVLAYCQAQEMVLLLVIDRIDRLTDDNLRYLGHTLRALRDQFRETLLLLMGMRLVPTYLEQLFTLGDLGRLLSTHSYIVGGLSERDSHFVVDSRTRIAGTHPTDLDRTTFLTLSGSYPTLLKAVIQWWLTQTPPPPHAAWQAALLQEMGIQLRLREIWHCLSSQERAAIHTIRDTPGTSAIPAALGIRLVQMGLCRPYNAGWQLSGRLLIGLG